MKLPWILYRYISINLIINFIVSVLIFTFILFTVSMARIADWLSSGASLWIICKMFLLLLPYLLSSCIPMAFLTSVLLIFGRMSNESEIVAMRASGISIYQISYPVILLGIIISCFSLPLNNQILAKTHYEFRKTIYSLGIQKPTSYLEAGDFIDTFDGYNIFIKDKKDNQLSGIVIYQKTDDDQTRTITAKDGVIDIDQENKVLTMTLNDGNISEPKDNKDNEFLSIKFGNYQLNIDASKILKDPSNVKKKHKNMTIQELNQKILKTKNSKTRSVYRTEIHKKLSISFACLVFAFIGIPLGIRTHRSEKSIGTILSLIITLVYYLLIILGKAFDQYPSIFPHLMMWIPTVFIGLIGIYLLRKVANA